MHDDAPWRRTGETRGQWYLRQLLNLFIVGAFTLPLIASLSGAFGQVLDRAAAPVACVGGGSKP